MAQTTYSVSCYFCKNRYEALREFKADDYLAKPLDVEQLMAVLLKNVG